MQTIAQKLSRVATIAKAIGFTSDDTRRLVHGCGGSPRRAIKAVKLGFAEQMRDAYIAELAESNSHVQATQVCNALWLSIVGGPADDTQADTDAEPDETGTEFPEAEPVAAVILPAEQAFAAIATAVLPINEPSNIVKSLKAYRKSLGAFEVQNKAIDAIAAESADLGAAMAAFDGAVGCIYAGRKHLLKSA